MHEFLRSQGHWGEAVTLHEMAREAAHAAGNQLAEARALTDLGDMQFLADEYPGAAASLARALELYRGLGDRAGEAATLTRLGTVQQATGDSPAATASLTRALELHRGLGDRPGEAGTLTRLGAVQQATGDSPAATASLTRALELHRGLGDRPGRGRRPRWAWCRAVPHGRLPPGGCRTGAGRWTFTGTSATRLGEAKALTDLSTVQYFIRENAAAAAGPHQGAGPLP